MIIVRIRKHHRKYKKRNALLEGVNMCTYAAVDRRNKIL